MRTAFEELTRDHTAQPSAEPGFFSWDLTQGKIYADNTVADIFGHDRMSSSQGLSVECYLDRVHTDHCSRVARAIATTLMTGASFHETYLVKARDGFFHETTVIARCFRAGNGDPVNFSGIVIPHIQETSEVRAKDTMLWHCLSAYDLAVGNGDEHMARQMLAVLSSLNASSVATKRLQ